MPKEKIYLAYGSNINQRQMAQRCPFAKVLGSGYIEGQELQFKGVATITPKKDAVTPVLAWTIKPSDEARLDVYEGYPSMYIKKTFDVKIGGENMTGMAYVMNKLRPQFIPSQSYYDCIAEGYRKAGMDMSYLKDALKRARMEQESRNIYYLAYGSNINQKQMANRCPESKPVATAKLPDYELQFKDYATISPSENSESHVPILVWKITPGDELRLDSYEGYPRLYRKEFFEYTHDGKSDIAMAYVMNGNSPLSVPTRSYYNGVLEGYQKVGFDETVLENAYQKALDAEQEMKRGFSRNRKTGFDEDEALLDDEYLDALEAELDENPDGGFFDMDQLKLL